MICTTAYLIWERLSEKEKLIAVKWLRTAVNETDYLAIREFCGRHGLSVYALVKRAVLDHIEPRTPPPGTSEMTDHEASIVTVAERLSTIPREGIDMILSIIDVMLEVPSVELVTILQTEKSKRSEGRGHRSGDMQKVPLQK